MKTRAQPVPFMAIWLSLATAASAFTIYTNPWPFDQAEATRRQQETAADVQMPVQYDVDLGSGVTLPLILIPAGRSRIGAPTSEPGFEWDEQLRAVTIVEPFYLTKYQITRGQYKAVMGHYPTYAAAEDTTGGGDSLPARMSYVEARDQFVPALNAKLATGMTARIPIQENWEHACRAGTQTIWYTGNEETDIAKIAWYNGNSGNVIHRVGQKQPNPWGLYDMIGNVWTWVNGTPSGDGTSLVRGGAYNADPFGNGCRTANLFIQSTPSGVRLQVSLPPEVLLSVRQNSQLVGSQQAMKVGARSIPFANGVLSLVPGVSYTVLGRAAPARNASPAAPQLIVVKPRGQ